MKQVGYVTSLKKIDAFSALGRAVWDETKIKLDDLQAISPAFSALGRAVWDETIDAGGSISHGQMLLSVLSVEPYGMKLF